MKIRYWTFIALGLLPTASRAGDEAQWGTVRPLLDLHCVRCHNGPRAKGGLDLEAKKPADIAAALQNMKTLDKIAERLRSQTMPPPDSEKPLAEKDRNAILAWIETQIDRSLAGESNPGRIAIRRLTRVDYRNTIRDLLGVTVDTSGFPSDDVAHGFDNLADVISLPPLLMERYADAAELVAKKWFEGKIKLDPVLLPSKDRTPRQLAEKILLPLQERAFRRPTTGLEHHYLLTFFEQCLQNKFSYDEAMQASAMRILLSPPFLYRIERDGPIGQDYKLDDFELATRLSYFLWSSMPDDTLVDLARRGTLQQGDNLKQQVERMLKDAKVRQGLVGNFAGQWLQTQRLRAIRPDAKAFPQFDEALRGAMEQETLHLFETIVREDLPLTDLLDADYTFVNERLAKHYGMAGVKGDAFQRVSLKDLPRRGVLTHAGILAINSHPTRTSPVLRGKWIMEAILGTPPPPPPVGVSDLEAVKVAGTFRQKLEAHRSNPRCASCHVRMDALGLAFENYDSLGVWRTKDENQAIDSAGELTDGGKFAGAAELATLLRQKHSGTFRKNLVQQMLVYSLGRTLGMYDRLPLRRIDSRVAADKDRISSLVLAIAESDAFRLRRNPGRIGVEKLPESFVFDMGGNPDQQSVLMLKRNPHAKATEDKQAVFELHTLRPLLNASTPSGQPVVVGKAEGGPQVKQAFRYPITAPVGEPVYLSFLKGMIGQKEYSDDFVKPIAFVAPSDEGRILDIAQSSHSWNGSLIGPANIRPGSLLAFDFDVELVAKQSDSVDVYLATTGGSNSSMISNSGPFSVKGEGKHRLTQVGIRNATTHDAWNSNITLVIHTRTQTVISNVSPIRVIRPQLGLSDKGPIQFAAVAVNTTAESLERRVFNAQTTALTDQKKKNWGSVLYGMCRVGGDPKRAYFMTTENVGVELIGEHADRFEIVGKNALDKGRGLKLVGADGKPGLEGGPEPETEPFRVRFLGAPQAGTYRAALRVVTQAGNVGAASSGKKGEPTTGFYYVEIPVEAVVQ